MNTAIERLYHTLKEEMLELKNMLLQSENIDDSNTLLYEMSEHIISAGGKRLRPLLTLAIGKITSPSNKINSNHLYLAAAVELIHTATLLHDDVIDSSSIRRNLPTANSIWGDKATILAGDNMFSKAFQFMVSAGSMNALEILANASAIISEAEVWQLQLLGKVELKIETYLQLITNKTAVLLSAACTMGAIANNCDTKTLDAISQFGINFGICYQIYDDLLDYIGSPETLGKDSFQDISEGKITLPLIFLMKKLQNSENKQKVISLIGKEKIENTERTFIKTLLEQHKIQDEIKNYTMQFHEKAVFHLSKVNSTHEINELLTSMISELLERRY